MNAAPRPRAAPASSAHALPPSLALVPHALAVLWLGLMAGFFGTYSGNVNLATLTLDGPTYAVVQSELNRNVRHPLFFALFFGPPVWCLLALATGWSRRREGWWPVLAAVAVAYLAGIVFFTREVNLPLNALTEGWNPAAVPPDWAAVRAQWNAANLWRALLSLVAFVAGLATLVWRTARAFGPWPAPRSAAACGPRPCTPAQL